jgi:hypothetical protein
MKYASTLLLFLICNLTVCSQTILKYDLEVGDIFTVEQNAEQTIIQNIDGATHELKNKLSGTLEFEVVKANEDNYEIDFLFKDLNLLVNSSIQGELMNVKAKEVNENDMQSQIFNSLLHTPVRIILSYTGDILEVTGGDSLVNKMVNASGLEDDFSKNMMKNGLQKEFGSEALSNSYKQLTYFYSDSIVSVGDSWKNEYTGKLIAKNTWTLNATGLTTLISGKADVVMSTSESGTEMNLKGIQNTRIEADSKTGFIKKMTVEGEAEGISTMSPLGVQEIPTTITSTITYTLIK